MNHVRSRVFDFSCDFVFTHLLHRNERYLSNVSIRRNDRSSSHHINRHLLLSPFRSLISFIFFASNTSFDSILLLMRSYYLILEWKSIFHVSLMSAFCWRRWHRSTVTASENLGGSLLASKRKFGLRKQYTHLHLVRFFSFLLFYLWPVIMLETVVHL